MFDPESRCSSWQRIRIVLLQKAPAFSNLAGVFHLEPGPLSGRETIINTALNFTIFPEPSSEGSFLPAHTIAGYSSPTPF